MMLFNKVAARRPTLVGNLTHASLYMDAEPAVAAPETTYDTIDVELDQDAPIFWCWMRPPGKPIVTNPLLSRPQDHAPGAARNPGQCREAN